MCITSLNLNNNPMRKVLFLYPLYKYDIWVSERQSVLIKEHSYQQQGSEPDLLPLDPTDFIPITNLNLFNITSAFHLPGTISLPPLRSGLGV